MNRAERGVLEILVKRAASTVESDRDRLFRQAFRIAASTGRIKPSFMASVDRPAYYHARRVIMCDRYTEGFAAGRKSYFPRIS